MSFELFIARRIYADKTEDGERFSRPAIRIAMVGVAIWYTAAPWKRGKWAIALMVFAFILTSLTSTDLFPKHFRMVTLVRYALKALPVTLIWFVEMWELLTKDYAVKIEENTLTSNP